MHQCQGSILTIWVPNKHHISGCPFGIFCNGLLLTFRPEHSQLHSGLIPSLPDQLSFLSGISHQVSQHNFYLLTNPRASLQGKLPSEKIQCYHRKVLMNIVIHQQWVVITNLHHDNNPVHSNMYHHKLVGYHHYLGHFLSGEMHHQSLRMQLDGTFCDLGPCHQLNQAQSCYT